MVKRRPIKANKVELKKWTGNKKTNKIQQKELHNGGGNNMATQIAATPILYGEEAKKVWEEANTIPSERAKENGRKLIEKFAKMIKK